MLKTEIIEKITKYFNLTNFEAENIYNDFFQNIITGVKEDNISQVSILGEFILKYDESNAGRYKKTIEFLISENLEEGLINANVSNIIMPSEVSEEINYITESKPELNPAEKEEEIIKVEENESVSPPEPQENLIEQQKEETAKVIYEETRIESPGSLEDEIKRKREEIIHKLDPQHQESYHPLLHVTEGIPLNVPKPIVLQDTAFKDEINQDEIKNLEENITEIREEIKEQKEEISAPVINENEMETKEVDELSSKTFSDYFTEVKEEQRSFTDTPGSVVIPPAAQVIPPAAVDLHNEIIGDRVTKPPESFQDSETSAISNQNGNGYSEETESKTADNSYYIWYKDSEPNAVDTQTMSYEYELLYQATKEAEYKSKLRIYVTTFILFFSVVLLLLIFSPVIYKYFFTPAEEQLNIETPPVTNNNAITEQSSQQTTENNTTQPVTNEQQNIQPEQKVSQTDGQNVQKEQTTAQQDFTGLVKTDAGWKDEKTGVLYVQLGNGKFAIQESAWNSEEKANKRISRVASYNISGMSGNFIKVDLGAKGTWFRVRFGEFSTIEEAKQKAAELKNKE